ncbi:MAG: WYL domain-containing protein [Firmicutes bacterium]|jgi:predicted DNA-binding transcriptional regulator YafY|nr:WYL domain-containing protein [Bacillota bacterium]
MARGMTLSNTQRSSLFRLYKIDQFIRSGLYPNVPSLSSSLEVSTRTIERDIEFLRDSLGAPLKYDAKRRGYFYTSDEFSLPRLKLTEGELVALYLGQKLLTQYKGTPYEAGIIRALAKIKTFLPENVEVDFAEIDSFLSFDVEPPRGEGEYLVAAFQAVVSAIQDRESLDVTYYTASRDAVSQRRIDPYHLRYHQGAWYLIAYCHTRCEVRIFALDRVRSLNRTGKHFEPQPDFSLEDYLYHSLGIERGRYPCQVVIRFDVEQSRWVQERLWHPSQELEQLEDGTVLLKLTLSGLGEAKRWVLGFGRHAEVLEPAKLREELKHETAYMAAVYADQPRCE